MWLDPILVPDFISDLYLRDHMCTIKYIISAKLTKLTINLRYNPSKANKA